MLVQTSRGRLPEDGLLLRRTELSWVKCRVPTNAIAARAPRPGRIVARRGLELEPEVQRYVGQDGAGPAWVRRVKPKAARSGPEWEDGMEWLRPNGMGWMEMGQSMSWR